MNRVSRPPRRCHALRALILASSVLAPPALAQSLPSGGQVVSGSATIATSSGTMTIDQHSDRLIANWQDFSIGSGERVVFNQPDARAVALNRVIGQNPSQILGRLDANGQVFLINPNGVAIGKGAQVQAGGFVASTLGISDADFLAGTYRFGGTGGGIVNEGDLSGKIVALIAPAVTNAGTIRGDTALAAGTDVLLDFGGDGLISVEVKASTLATLVENKGLIRADGGLAVLTAKGASDATRALVNNSGTIEARTIGTRNGRILLLGDMQSGAVHAGGTLDASAPAGGDGGFVEASAAKVTIDPGAQITTAAAGGATGRFLIDPNDYRIAASGGDITGAALGTLLASNNVILASATGATSGNGDIFVNDAVSWSANTLTLSAERNIEINAAMRASGTAGLALEVGQGAVAAGNGADYLVRAPIDLAATGSFSTRLGSDGATVGYTILTSLGAEGSTTGTDLQGINGALTGNFVLGADIDASTTASWNAGQGWMSIGGGAFSAYPIFSGRFDGLGHRISGLTLNRPGGTGYNAGLFGYSTGTIQNVNLRDASITGNARVGAVIGNNNGLVAYVSATGTVTAGIGVGGVAGVSAGTLRDSHSGANVFATGTAGGLVGGNLSLLTRSYSDGTVTVTGNDSGGLAGANNGTITDSYSLAAVSGGNNVGGLVGQSSGPISGSYASGPVSGTTSLGGLIGRSNNNIDTSYWDLATTGVAVACGSGGGICTATGLTTDQAINFANYADFGSWAACGSGICTSDGIWFMTDRTRPMLVSEWRSTITNLHELQITGLKLDGSYTLADDLHFETIRTGSSRGNLWATGSGGGYGFAPLSSFATPFTGSFDGNDHVVSGLYVIASSGSTGLFGATATGAALRDFSLTGVLLDGTTQVGMVVGVNQGLIDNVHAEGTVFASGVRVGGIAGFNSGTIRNASAEVVLSGGNGNVGGLVGQNEGVVTLSHAGGSVTGAGSSVGGLIGGNGGDVSVSFATADVSAPGSAGGLVGNNGSGGVILYTYATGSVVSSVSAAGGLVGANVGQVVESYASGSVTGASASVGGLIGNNGGVVSAGAWNIETSGRALAIGIDTGTSATFGGTTAQMRDPFRYIDKSWHFAGIWATPRAGGMPVLRPLSNGVPYYAYYARFSGTPSRTYGDVIDLSGITRTGIGANMIGYAWGSAAGSTANAGSHALGDPGVLALTYNVGSASDYYITYSGALTVTPRVLSLSGARSYDGSADIAAGVLTLGNLANGETLVLSGTGTMADKHVGSGKAFALGTLGLGDGTGLASNYTLAGGAGSVDIAKAVISAVTGITAASRTYDRTTGATLDSSGAALVGMVTGDDLSVATASGAFADRNAGTGKTVNITGISLGGGDAGNYILAATTAAATADITPATIAAITGILAASRTYDGTTDATLDTSGAGFTGILAGDALRVATATGAFADKNAGTGKTVNVTGLTLGGADAANYVLAASTATTSADIARATISAVTGITAASRVYDRTTGATLDSSGAALVGMVAGDDLSVATASGAFADRNAGTGKTVNITGISLGGGDAGNYTLAATTATATADITPATIAAITGITGTSRTYDGTTDAALDTSGAGFTGILAGDALRVATATGAFADKHAGTGKTVNVTGLTLGGADAANYTLAASTATTSADIARATISAVTGVTAVSRVYDGTTGVALDSSGATFAGMVAGDGLSVATASGALADRNAGTGKTVNITGISLGGGDARNYILATTTATATADITPATMAAITGILAASRTYDGTTDATLDTSGAGFAGILAGDVLSIATATGAFADKNAGTGKTVNVTGLTLGGADAANYVLAASTATTSADIARATISAVTGITAASRVYDRTTGATLDSSGATFAGMVAGDDLSVTGIGSFADRNAGTGKAVTIAGLTLGGSDAGNYTLAATDATASADIAPATIGAITGLIAASRVYDGTTAATLDTGRAGFTGLIAGDSLTVATAAAAFADKHAGTGKTVTITGLTLGGADARNYVLNTSIASARADILPAQLVLAGVAVAGKTYDGTRAATILSAGALSGSIVGDQLGFTHAGAVFADRNAGIGKAVMLTGIALTGADAGNYRIAGTAGTTADIRPAVISAVTGIVARDKLFDGATDATLDLAGARFVGAMPGDRLTVSAATGQFADPMPGLAKPVSISGLALGGADATNYVLASGTAQAVANIILRSETRLLPDQLDDGRERGFEGPTATILGDPAPLIEGVDSAAPHSGAPQQP